MSLTLDFSDDPAEIWDNPEKIVYQSTRKKGNLAIRVATAIRHRQVVAEAGPSGGGIQQRTCKWFLPGKLLSLPSDFHVRAKPGDLITLESNDRPIDLWHVNAVNYEELDGVYELDCTELTISEDLADSIDVVSPLNRQDAALGRRILWTPRLRDVRVKIQEVSTATVIQDDRRSTKRTYLIYVQPGTKIDVTEEDQIVDRATGDVYEVVGYTNPEQLTEAQIINAERVP